MNDMSSLSNFYRKAGRLLWCGLGAAISIFVALILVGPLPSPFLLASLGGSTIYLFGLTRDPATQPRALFGGHIGGALIGVVCYQCVGELLWVYALAEVPHSRLYAYYQNSACACRCHSPRHDSEPCKLLNALATSLCRRVQPRGSGVCVESYRPRIGSLPGGLARQVATIQFLGRLERLAGAVYRD